VAISVIDVAVDSLGSRAVIVVFQDEEKGTPIQDPSNGVVPTSCGRLEQGWLGEGVNTRTTN
jgi:hypothetical protein